MNMPKGPLTNILVGINVLIFLVVWLGGFQQQAVVEGALIPARLTGALGSAGAYDFWWPAWVTLLTHAFLHIDFSHLLFNMLILFFCGRFVELALGWKLMGLVYLTGAIAGGLAETAWSPGSLNPVLGASGAIAAIIAGYMVLFARNRPKPVGPLPAEIARGAQLLLLWIGLNLMVAFAFGGDGIQIAIAAHIAGFIVGLVLSRPLLILRYRKA